MRELELEGAWVYEPRLFDDDRGTFLESFRGQEFQEATGHRLQVAQANLSVSSRGTIRGIHFADVPPGQAKYVTCVRGIVLDVVVDIRVGSPTFGEWTSVQLDDVKRNAIYIAEGLGHAFFALTDDATVTYLCSEAYNPEREHGINPLDPGIGIHWPDDIPALLSEKDAAGPSLQDAADQGLLPSYDECRRYYRTLRDSA